MSATFNLSQQVMTVVLRATSLGRKLPDGKYPEGDTAFLTKLLKDLIDQFFSDPTTIAALGQWSTVWGPAVYVKPHTKKPANAMYVAANADKSVYVVGIAGTDAISIYDWFREDFDVAHVVDWNHAFPSIWGLGGADAGLKPTIAAGTHLGVSHLLQLADGSGVHVKDFLKSNASKNTTLIIGGHSLGGALSPTLALALFDPKRGPLHKSDWANVFVLPTAGPTPGNADFARLFAETFPPTPAAVTPAKPIYVWNQDIWNTHDIVPHSWVVAMLQQIPTIYSTITPEFKSELDSLVKVAISKSNQGAEAAGSPYTQLNNVGFDHPALYGGNTPINDLKTFLAEVLQNHVKAYYEAFGITSLFTE